MEMLGIVIGTIYITIVGLVLIAQILYETFLNYGESKIPWKLVLKQSFGWPVYLVKFIYNMRKGR